MEVSLRPYQTVDWEWYDGHGDVDVNTSAGVLPEAA